MPIDGQDSDAAVAASLSEGGNSPGGEPTIGHFLDRSGIIHPAMAGYFDNKLFSDLTVLAPNGRRMVCHQVVLSSGSKRFAKILEQGILQDEPELPVWGVDSDALEAVLKCFYTGECHLNAINVVAVMDAAQRLEVTNLAAFCESFVTEVLQPHTCFQLMIQAVHFKMEELEQHVLQYSESCFVEVTSQDDFFKADLQLIKKFLEYHKPRTDSTLVLRAGWEWLVADSDHNEHVAEIAASIPLPDGLTEEDLLHKGHADTHGVVWRQPEIFPPPELIKDDVLLGGLDPTLQGVLDGGIQPGPLPQLHMLQQAGLLPGLPGLSMLGMPNGSSDGLSTPGGTTPLMGMPGTNAWSQNLASELLAQLGNVANGFGLNNLNGMATPPDLVALGGREKRPHSVRSYSQGDDDDDVPGSTYSTGPPSSNITHTGGGGGSGRARVANGRGGGPRGVCQVEGCNTDLGGLRDYHQRYKICEFHLKIPSVLKDGVQQRFCQQCGRFQAISEFEGNKRSCKARLQRHNDRRRKRLEEEPSGGYYGNGKRAARDDDSHGSGRGAGHGAAGGTGGGGSRGGANAWAGGLPGLANLQVLAELMNRVNTATTPPAIPVAAGDAGGGDGGTVADGMAGVLQGLPENGDGGEWLDEYILVGDEELEAACDESGDGGKRTQGKGPKRR